MALRRAALSVAAVIVAAAAAAGAPAGAAAFRLSLGAAASPTPCGARSSLQVLRLDSAWLTPDALFDAARGRLHVVYGTADKDAFYAFSDGGAFSAPVKLNTAGLGVTTTMGERGPKLTAGANGRLIVAWADLWTGPGCRVYARSSFSTDGGATWSAPASIAPNIFGIDGLSIAAGTYVTQQVVATFHVNTSEATNASSATWLHYALSDDGAASWRAPQVLRLDGGRTPAVACSMCMTRPRFDADTGELLVAFRSAIGNVRSFRVARAPGAETNDFASTVVNPTDAWNISYCPMNGPELSLFVPPQAADATQLVAYMTGDANNVYFRSMVAGATVYSAPVSTPLRERNERYPTAVASPTGDVLFLWQVGPMAVSGNAVVKFACYAPNNATAAQSGTLGMSFAGTKATALDLGDHGGLLVLTTAA